jgi:2-polyprenyl-3-methyl-5-hydroxy-6-metoxy-1,4-benzoquinol methylase
VSRTNCPVCNNTETVFYFNYNAKQSIYKCNPCTLQFLSPQLDDVDLTKLYSENYYLAWGLKGDAENESIKHMKISTFNLRLDLIAQFKKSGKILDVGCATGYFLEAAKAKAYDPFGIEFSDYSARLAKNKFGDKNIFKGTLEQSDFENGTFDIIAMSDLIEHVRNPIETLSRANQLLKTDGFIMIMTPDTGSVSYKLMKQKWTHYKLEHFYYFNKQAIQIAALHSGFELVHYERAKKSMNFDYLHTQLNVYKNKLFTPIINLIYFILPKAFLRKIFNLSLGEMVVILRKKNK